MNTIEEAKLYVRRNAVKGVRCPCCEGYAKVYKRKIYDSMAIMLVYMYANYGTRYVHISDITKALKQSYRGGDFSKLTYWGLIDSKSKDKDRTDVKSDGYWKITSNGEEFIKGQRDVYMYAFTYNGAVTHFAGKYIKVWDCFKNRFDYQELMGTELKLFD